MEGVGGQVRGTSAGVQGAGGKVTAAAEIEHTHLSILLLSFSTLCAPRHPCEARAADDEIPASWSSSSMPE